MAAGSRAGGGQRGLSGHWEEDGPDSPEENWVERVAELGRKGLRYELGEETSVGRGYPEFRRPEESAP